MNIIEIIFQNIVLVFNYCSNVEGINKDGFEKMWERAEFPQKPVISVATKMTFCLETEMERVQTINSFWHEL